jgi:hypothetical protein
MVQFSVKVALVVSTLGLSEQVRLELITLGCRFVVVGPDGATDKERAQTTTAAIGTGIACGQLIGVDETTYTGIEGSANLLAISAHR